MTETKLLQHSTTTLPYLKDITSRKRPFTKYTSFNNTIIIDNTMIVENKGIVYIIPHGTDETYLRRKYIPNPHVELFCMNCKEFTWVRLRKEGYSCSYQCLYCGVEKYMDEVVFNMYTTVTMM
jgi:hypothetical protein